MTLIIVCWTCLEVSYNILKKIVWCHLKNSRWHWFFCEKKNFFSNFFIACDSLRETDKFSLYRPFFKLSGTSQKLCGPLRWTSCIYIHIYTKLILHFHLNIILNSKWSVEEKTSLYNITFDLCISHTIIKLSWIRTQYIHICNEALRCANYRNVHGPH